MPQPPPNVTAEGAHVRLRGRPAWGVLKKVDTHLWAMVDWAEGASGPKLVHLHELVKD
jgi:hypothetical protein